MIDIILIRTSLMSSRKTRVPQPEALSRDFYWNLNSAFSEWMYYRLSDFQNSHSFELWDSVFGSLPFSEFRRWRRLKEYALKLGLWDTISRIQFFIAFIAWLKFLYGQSVRFPASFPCLSFPAPFFVHCPYKGRINRAESVLTGLKAY